MRFFNLNYLLSNNFHVLDSEPIIYRWGGGINYSNVSIVLNDFIILNINSVFFKIKKVFFITFDVILNKGVCVFFFLDFYKRFLLNDLLKPELKNFYIVFINKMYGFLSRFKYFIVKYNNFKYFSNYINKDFGSFRFPAIVFLTKKCWKIYKNYFYIFIRLRLISVKIESFIDQKENICYNLNVNDSRVIYDLFKFVYFLSNKYYKIW